jgi:hypothetical protein
MFETCYHRGLFPDSYFTPVRMNAMDGMTVNVLRGASDDAIALLSWEKGVADALDKGYLKSLLFGIATDSECTQILEEYVFLFGNEGLTATVAGKKHEVLLQPAAGAASAAASAAPGPAPAPNAASEADRVRYEVSRLLRMLVTVTRTLEKVPDDRYLFAKMVYHDGTPDDYQPPLFSAATHATAANAGFFPRRPFTMRLGSVRTPHHAVSLAVKSTLDAGGGGTGAAATEGGDECLAAAARGATTAAGGDDAPVAEPLGSALLDGCESDMDEVAAPAPRAGATEARDRVYGDASTAGFGGAGGGGGGGGAGNGASFAHPAPIAEEQEEEEEEDEGAALASVVASLRAYAQGRARVSFSSAMAAPTLCDAPVARLEAAFAALCTEGVLSPLRRGGDSYLVVAAAAAEAAAVAAEAAAAAAAAAASMGAMRLGGGGGQATEVAAVDGGAVDVARRQGEDDDLTMAEEEDGGAAATVQQPLHLQQQQQKHPAGDGGGAFFASQRSAAGNKNQGGGGGSAPNKASIVQKPIRQTAGGRVAKPSVAAAPSAAAKAVAAAEAVATAAPAARGGGKAAAAAALPPPAPPAGRRPARNRRAPARM